MIIEVDPGSPTPPYEQIRAQIATMIEAGTLPVWAQLPTIRQLASDLGLAANTVARAYRELEAGGWVVSRVRHGTTVAPRVPLAEADVRRRLQEAAQSYATLAHQLGVDPGQAEETVRSALQGGETEPAPHRT